MEQDLYLHGLIGGTPAAEPLWTRPADWLAVPDLSPTDDKIYLLVNVVPDSTTNYIAFKFTGNYTVDWGDGNTENIASGDSAIHQYDWDDISPETLTSDGYRQVLITITPQEGNNITLINFQERYPNTSLSYASKCYEIKINCPNATTVQSGPGYLGGG